MKHGLAWLVLVIPIASASARGPLPFDVRKFIDRREGCDHIRGEVTDLSAMQRSKDLSREIGTLCKGTDKELAHLKKKYASNAWVMQRLNEFEDSIEAQHARVTKKRMTGHAQRKSQPSGWLLAEQRLH